MKSKLIAGAFAASIPTAAAAMPVDAFLAKAEALQAKGFTAVFSSDYKLLMSVVKADAVSLKSEREAAKAANKTPAYCPPGPVGLSSDDTIAAMRAVPPAQRTATDSKAALRAFLAKRYPCRA